MHVSALSAHPHFHPVLQNVLTTDTKEWLSTDRDRHRMANFGTKAMGADAPDSTANSASTGNTSATLAQQGGDRAVLDVTDEAWKSEIEVGSLLDARDVSQVWYQVRYNFFYSANNVNTYIFCSCSILLQFLL